MDYTSTVCQRSKNKIKKQIKYYMKFCHTAVGKAVGYHSDPATQLNTLASCLFLSCGNCVATERYF